MLGYDWPRLHAALNDLPVALLMFSVLFDFLGAINKRDSLKAAGYWCLFGGVAGGLVAAGSGLMSESRVEHSDRAHDLMEMHETLAFVVIGIFAVMLLWRIVRRMLSAKEQPIYLTVGAIGVVMIVITGKVGGSLVFDHALGISHETMERVMTERAGGHTHEELEHEHDHPAAAHPDTTKH